MGWSATELHQQDHTELCKKTSSLCESLGRTTVVIGVKHSGGCVCETFAYICTSGVCQTSFYCTRHVSATLVVGVEHAVGCVCGDVRVSQTCETCSICSTSGTAVTAWSTVPRSATSCDALASTRPTRWSSTTEDAPSSVCVASLLVTSCCSTGAERPHRCCHLPHKVENIDGAPDISFTVQWARVSPNLPLSMGVVGSHLIHGSSGPFDLNTLPKRHFGLFDRFCMAYSCDQQTDRHTNHETSVTIGRILCLA